MERNIEKIDLFNKDFFFFFQYFLFDMKSLIKNFKKDGKLKNQFIQLIYRIDLSKEKHRIIL